jgi:SanA protein
MKKSNALIWVFKYLIIALYTQLVILKKQFKKILNIFIAGAVVFCGIIAVTNIYIFHNSVQLILNPDQARFEKAAIIVLGASVYENTYPSTQLKDRLLTAADLYKKRLSSRILVSGDNGQKSYNEVAVMRDFLLSQGVKKSDIFPDYAGFRTYDTMIRAKKVFQLNDAYVVTQEYHLPRAVYLARFAGIEAYGVIADRQLYRDRLHDNFREIFARTWAMIDCITGRDPKFLGPEIPIR